MFSCSIFTHNQIELGKKGELALLKALEVLQQQAIDPPPGGRRVICAGLT